MADITITIPTEHVQRALDAICLKYDYTNNQLEGGETQAAFAKRMIAEWVKQITLRMESMLAREAAEDGVEEIDVT
jgi:hypothetical protein